MGSGPKHVNSLSGHASKRAALKQVSKMTLSSFDDMLNRTSSKSIAVQTLMIRDSLHEFCVGA